MVKLSKPSKMPCKSWSLQAVETCPGSRDGNGQLVPACSGCYARFGNYVYKPAKSVREVNRQDWQREQWVDEMVQALDDSRYFRWFDSGDCYHPGLAAKIYEVMVRTPWVRHWLPTRSYKIERIRIVLERMKELPNVSVRYSSDSITGEYVTGLHGSTIIPTPDSSFSGKVCESYQRDGKCGDCRMCWDKTIDLIGYPAHGRVMESKVRKALAA